jgi:WD40 repeat protein
LFPGPEAGGGIFYPSASANIAADATSHLAMVVFQDVEPPCNAAVGPLQVASYTVDYYGNLVSTNKGTNMPVPDVYPTSLSISPAGNLLAVGSNQGGPWFGTNPTTGLQIFHFNGANLITKFSATLTTNLIDSIAWDKSNHLFAIGNSGKKLYAFAITPTTITQAAGSPCSISNPSTLFVKPL